MHRVFVDSIGIAASLRDAYIDGPSALWRVCEMFKGRVIARFPSVELSLADEAHYIIGIRSRRLEEEPSCRHLAYGSAPCDVLE